MNFIKSGTKNRLGTDVNAVCLNLKPTNHELRIKTLADKMQQQKFLINISNIAKKFVTQFEISKMTQSIEKIRHRRSRC